MITASEKSLFSSLKRVMLPFFESSDKKRAWSYLIGLFVFSITVSGIQVWMSYANRDMMNSFTERDTSGFYGNLVYYLFSILVAIPVGVGFSYTEQRFALIWREWLTLRLIKRYLFRRAYYQLRALPELDNPDQRITEDVKNFTTITLSLFLIMVNSVMTLFAFVGVLYSISFKLIIVLISYAIVGTLISYLIGKRLVGIHYSQYQKEADLRYNLVRIRDNAESIAFFRGEARERISLIGRLGSVVENNLGMIRWNRNLAFFTSGYNYIALVIPVVVIAPLYLQGEIKFGVVAQATGAFAQVLAALSLIITQFERISSYSAGVFRLGGLWQALTASDDEENDDPEIEIKEGTSLKLDGLSIRPPKADMDLISNINLTLDKGKGLLIMGTSGSGKSSLLRTIAGLWNSGGGEIVRPQLKSMMFLPQKPYLMPGSLRENLLYPTRDKSLDGSQLIETLERVNLAEIMDRINGDFDEILDWGNILSLGEQQRLAFGRLFIFQPDLAFLDESTSALDEENEKHLYVELRKLKISFVSVGHRSTLKKFHDQLLLLEGGAKWRQEVMNNHP